MWSVVPLAIIILIASHNIQSQLKTCESTSLFLQGHYDAIRHSPFQYHEGTDELSEVFFNPDHQGYLTKEGGKHKSWRKRWFILADNCLYYFKSPSDKEPLGIIPLENLEVREYTDTRKNVSIINVLLRSDNC